MANGSQWCVISYPTQTWAEKVFGKGEDSFERLLDAILSASRVTDSNDPVAEWREHIEKLAQRNKKLNDYNFKKLHFKNKLGTDLEVELVEGHIWAGGGETTQKAFPTAPTSPPKKLSQCPTGTAPTAKWLPPSP